MERIKNLVASLTDADVTIEQYHALPPDRRFLGRAKTRVITPTEVLITLQLDLEYIALAYPDMYHYQIDQTVRHEVAHIEHNLELLPRAIAIVEMLPKSPYLTVPRALRSLQHHYHSDHGPAWHKHARRLGVHDPRAWAL